MAHLFSDEVSTVTELKSRVDALKVFDDYSVAVESLIFDEDGRWLLMRRGSAARDEVGKLEGIGGRADESDDLLTELHREIDEEIGTDVDVEVVRFLEAKSDVATKILSDGTSVAKNWVIASFVCHLRSGEPTIQEPDKNEDFERISDLDIDPERLSSSCAQSLIALRREWQTLRDQLVR